MDLALLERAQQLGLERRVHIADLVEKEHSAVGEAELPGATGHPGGHSGFNAEEFGLQQIRGNGGAVDDLQRALSAIGRGVEDADDVLLADPGLAGDEHRDSASEQGRQLPIEGSHGCGSSHHVPGRVGKIVLVGQRGPAILRHRHSRRLKEAKCDLEKAEL